MRIDEGLIGHWKFHGDLKDSSATGLSSVNFGVSADAAGPEGKPNTAARFRGEETRIQVADHPALRPGTGDFSIAVWIHTEEKIHDVVGDIVAKFDPDARRGFNFSVVNNAGVTSTQSNYRNVHFGIDNGKIDPGWTDCGRPGNNLLVCALAVHEGRLYAATFETGADEAGHVYRYEGDGQWADCGSPEPCNAVKTLAVFQDRLYCGTGLYKASGSCLPASPNELPGGKVFRYDGGTQWTDCGRVGDAISISAMAVCQGDLYVAPTYDMGVYRYAGEKRWEPLGLADTRIMCLAVYHGRLYGLSNGIRGVFCYEGNGHWTHCGYPHLARQLYSAVIYQGKMHIGTWPNGEVFRYEGASAWANLGFPGYPKEVMGMALYNGKFYAGTLPMADVYRFDGERNWAYTGGLDKSHNFQLRRAWSMCVHDGKLFCGTLPSGHVYSLEAGKLATVDRVLKSGWRHLVAIREGNHLNIYVDGKPAAASSAFKPEDYDVTNDRPLLIGFGQHDYFKGLMSDLRIYNRGLRSEEVAALAKIG